MDFRNSLFQSLVFIYVSGMTRKETNEWVKVIQIIMTMAQIDQLSAKPSIWRFVNDCIFTYWEKKKNKSNHPRNWIS